MAMTEVAEGLSSSLSVERRIQPTYGYYRQRNGWIKAATTTRLERVKYIERGWQHLAAYGAFDFMPYTANHPLEGLFMFGGAKEMPVDQILQMGLYLNPPLVPTCKHHLTQYHRAHTSACWVGAKPVEFPQLAGMDPALLKGYPCEFCDRVLPTAASRKQHQQVAHKTEINNMQAGRSLAEAIAGGVPPGAVAQPVVTHQPDVSALLERIASLEKVVQEKEKNRVRMAKARDRKKKPENLSAPQ